jgi:hypothetical protein
MIIDAQFPVALIDVLRHVQYKDWHLRCVTGLDGLYIEWKAPVKCIHTGNTVVLSSRPRYLRHDISESELVRMAFDCARDMEMHELGENFRYRGKRVFNPHISVPHLLEICDHE